MTAHICEWLVVMNSEVDVQELLLRLDLAIAISYCAEAVPERRHDSTPHGAVTMMQACHQIAATVNITSTICNVAIHEV